MRPEEFIAAVRRSVRDGGIRAVVKNLEAPPGRSPAAEDREMSNWYKHLSDDDRAKLHKVIAEAVDTALFGILCVLDGVSQIEDPAGRGELVLEHVGPKGRTRLNDFEATFLHDLFQAGSSP